ITAVSAITPVGLGASATTAAIRAGISRVRLGDYLDSGGNNVAWAMIPDREDRADPVDRLAAAAETCVGRLLSSLADELRDRTCHLLLAGATPDRLGPLYETASDEIPVRLGQLLSRASSRGKLTLHAQGNPGTLFALGAALELLRKDPGAICIVGAADSLLDPECLDFLEEDERLRSGSTGRPHALAPGEAACFFVVEFPMRRPRPVLAE